MKFKALILIGAIVASLPSEQLWAQIQTNNTNAIGQARYGVANRGYFGGPDQCGVSDPTMGIPGRGCCQSGERCYGCCGLGCYRPRIVQAIVYGMDRVVDRTADALLCIFTRPCYGPAACGNRPSPCCVKNCAPIVERPCYRRCCAGCTGSDPVPQGTPAGPSPFSDDPDPQPMAPKDARNYQLWNMKPPTYGNVARPQIEPTPAKVRPASHAEIPTKSVLRTSPKLAAPRPLPVDNSNAAELAELVDEAPETSVPKKSIRRTSAAEEYSSRIPKNPLRD